MDKLKNKSVTDVIRVFLINSFMGGQQELRDELARQGYSVTQSTISRVLRKLGAVRAYNDQKEAYYVLPSEDSLPPVDSTIGDLVTDVVANESLIVVSTKPGSASLIARHLDFNADTVIGTIGGDDCILVVPQSTKKISATLDEIKKLLGYENDHNS